MTESVVSRRFRFLSALALGALLAALPFTFGAAEGNIPIYQAGTTITTSGHYYVSRDLDGSSISGHVITINAMDVTLDLNGHTLIASPSYYGISSTASRVRVTNGTIVGGTYGVALTTGEAERADHLTLVGQSAVGLRCSGTAVANAEVIVEDNRVAGNGTCMNGISLGYVNPGRIEGNVVRSCTGAGIDLSSSRHCAVVRNVVSNSLNGIVLDGSSYNSLDANVASSNGQYGIDFFNFSDYNVYSGNRARNNGLANYSIVGTGNTDGGGNF
jgi:parallel beta-helix repeat protein